MADRRTPIYAYLEKPSLVDFPGYLSAVFFISGCNFRCGFCHNESLIKRQPNSLSFEQLDQLCTDYQRQWVNGAVLTGGEPTGAVHLPEFIQHLKTTFGFAIKLDTNGSLPEQLEACLPLVDYVAMDIKCSLETYAHLAGFHNMSAIQRSITLIKDKALDYEFRTTIIDSIHTDTEMDKIAKLIQGSRRYILQPFIPRNDLPDPAFRDYPRTSTARLQEIKGRIEGAADALRIRGS